MKQNIEKYLIIKKKSEEQPNLLKGNIMNAMPEMAAMPRTNCL